VSVFVHEVDQPVFFAAHPPQPDHFPILVVSDLEEIGDQRIGGTPQDGRLSAVRDLPCSARVKDRGQVKPQRLRRAARHHTRPAPVL
jgi:hypothetical protein